MTYPADTPANPQRAGDTVYEALRRRILFGNLAPGDRLSVPAIAQQYDVSRSPARDAVIRLVQEGLASDSVNRGAVIARVDRRELVSLYEAREGLEWAATRLAAQHTTPALRRRLLHILTEHEDAAERGDFHRHVELDAAFHRELRRAADSPVLERMLDDLKDRVVLGMRTTSVTGGMRRATADHRLIFEAVTIGDVTKAGEAARAHIYRLKELLKEPPHESGH